MKKGRDRGNRGKKGGGGRKRLMKIVATPERRRLERRTLVPKVEGSKGQKVKRSKGQKDKQPPSPPPYMSHIQLNVPYG